MSNDMDVVCPYCNDVQEPSPWLAAHWNESLIGTCGKCGKKFGLRSGATRKLEAQ